MISKRPSAQRGHFDFGWLDTRHSFSFGEYHDPAHNAFRSLRVLNEDRVEAGQGFGTHGHRDMEIFTWILEGALAHKDNRGNAGTLVPGDAQRMTAGTGITHSESNASASEEVHFLQIWVLPERAGLAPGYEQVHFPAADRRNQLRLVASRGGEGGSVHWNQNAYLYATLLDPGVTVAHALAPGRAGWVQVASGTVTVNGVALEAGDGAGLEAEARMELVAGSTAEVLVFDLA